jgi:transcription elongation factor GreA
MEFLTPAEKAKLDARLAHLKANRPVLSLRIQEAKALGDLKENADYHAAREDQAMEEAEIRTLEDRIKNAKVMEGGSVVEGMVFLGATVRLREVDSGDEDLYRLVGETSGSMSMEYIEVTTTSPMGEALMKSRVGEIVKVDAPRKVMRFEIVEIIG